MNVGRAALTVGGLTALSRVTGLGRDLLMAAALGAGPAADALFISLKLVDIQRRLFAEGAFAAAFVPLYIRLRASDGAAAAARFAGDALTVLGLALFAVVLMAEWLMPWAVRGLATGFVPGSLQYVLTVELGRITIPYLLLVSLAALFGSVLQASHRFAAAAFAPVALNVVLVAALVVTGAQDVQAARFIAWGVVAAGGLQVAWLAVAAWRAGLMPRIRWPRWSTNVRRLGRLLGPGLLGIGVIQLNLLVASWFATHLPTGTVAYLFYADRLVQLPIGIVGVALGTTLLPALSRVVGESSPADGILNRTLELGLLVGLPAAVGLALLAQPIVAVLFERGEFGPEAVLATGQMVAGLALGLPAQVLAKVMAPGFFAREDTGSPVWAAGLALAVNVAAAALLSPALGHIGLALAPSLASWVNLFGLAWILWRREHLRLDASLLRRALGLGAAAILMAAVLHTTRGLVAEPGAAALASVIGVGALVFLVAAWVAGAVDPRALARAARA
jgi:putative peptidoglycan lipid II flippase